MKNPRWEKIELAGQPTSRFGRWLSFRNLNPKDPSGLRFTVLQVHLPAGRGHPPVRHRRTHEWVHVLRGSATVSLDGRKLLLTRGTSLYISPGTWHSFKAGRAAQTALSIFWPPLNWKSLDVESRSER